MESKENKTLEEKIVKYFLNLGGGRIKITKSFPHYFAKRYDYKPEEVSGALENLARIETKNYSLEKSEEGVYNFVRKQ